MKLRAQPLWISLFFLAHSLSQPAAFAAGDPRVKEIKTKIDFILQQIQTIEKAAPACTSALKATNCPKVMVKFKQPNKGVINGFVEPYRAKFKKYKQDMEKAEPLTEKAMAPVDAAALSKVDACEGGKSTLLSDYQTRIDAANEADKLVAAMLADLKAEQQKFYAPLPKGMAKACAKEAAASKGGAIVGIMAAAVPEAMLPKTPLDALKITLTKDDNYPKCPPEAEGSLYAILKSEGGALASVIVSAQNLHGSLSSQSKALAANRKETEATLKCGEAKVAGDKKGSTEPPNSKEQEAAKNEKGDSGLSAGEKKEDPQAGDPKKAPGEVAEKDADASEGEEAVKPVPDQNPRKKEGAQDEVAEAAKVPLPTKRPEIKKSGAQDAVSAALKEADSLDPAKVPLPTKADRAGLAASSSTAVETYDPERDLWVKEATKPINWKEYDAYKESIGSRTVASGVNVDEEYQSFLSAKGLKIESVEDSVRLQKAINATANAKNGDLGVSAPSVYQDGVVGSRTKSALYWYKDDPIFLENLRKQGLIK